MDEVRGRGGEDTGIRTLISSQYIPSSLGVTALPYSHFSHH